MIVDSFEATGVRINSYERCSFFCFQMFKLTETLFARYMWKEHTSYFFGYPQQSPDKYWVK